LKRIWIGSSVG